MIITGLPIGWFWGIFAAMAVVYGEMLLTIIADNLQDDETGIEIRNVFWED